MWRHGATHTRAYIQLDVVRGSLRPSPQQMLPNPTCQPISIRSSLQQSYQTQQTTKKAVVKMSRTTMTMMMMSW